MSSLASSLIISVFLCLGLFMNKRKSEVIFVHQNLISNWLTYIVHAKSTGELISFGFSDRSVRSLVSANRSANRWDKTKKRLHFLAYLWSQSEFISAKVSAKDWSKKWNHPLYFFIIYISSAKAKVMRSGRFVCHSVCLFVCLSVSRSTAKLISRFHWNLALW